MAEKFNPDAFLAEEEFDPEEFLNLPDVVEPSDGFGLQDAVDISEKVIGAVDTASQALLSPITKPLGALRQFSEEGSEAVAKNIGRAGGSPLKAGLLGSVAALPATLIEAPIKGAELAQEGFDLLGEGTRAITQNLGASPEVSAGAGTAVNIIPEVLLSVLTRKPLTKATTTGVRATKRAATRALPSKKSLTRGIEQAESLAGIKQTIPTTSQVAKELGLKKSANIKDIINEVLDVRRSGKTLSPQLARDTTKLISDALNKSPGLVQSISNKLFGQTPSADALSSSLEKALASRAKAFTTGTVNQAAPRGVGLRKALGRQEALKRGAKRTGLLLGGSLGVDKLLDLIRQ